MAKVEFKVDEGGPSATQEYTIKNYFLKEDNKVKTKVKLVEKLDLEFTMKDGDSFTVSKEELEKLIKTGRVRSKEEYEKREKLKKGHTPLYKLSTVDKKLLLTNKPYEA